MKLNTFRVDIQKEDTNACAGAVTVQKDGKVILSRNLEKNLSPDDRKIIKETFSNAYKELSKFFKGL